MNLLLILSIPAMIAFGVMAAVLTRETWWAEGRGNHD